MLYRSFIEEIRHFDFIGDEETADAAVKAVLGTLASLLDVDRARLRATIGRNPLVRKARFEVF